MEDTVSTGPNSNPLLSIYRMVGLAELSWPDCWCKQLSLLTAGYREIEDGVLNPEKIPGSSWGLSPGPFELLFIIHFYTET